VAGANILQSFAHSSGQMTVKKRIFPPHDGVGDVGKPSRLFIFGYFPPITEQ
jgi:hypothetical protein